MNILYRKAWAWYRQLARQDEDWRYRLRRPFWLRLYEYDWRNALPVLLGKLWMTSRKRLGLTRTHVLPYDASLHELMRSGKVKPGDTILCKPRPGAELLRVTP